MVSPNIKGFMLFKRSCMTAWGWPILLTLSMIFCWVPESPYVLEMLIISLASLSRVSAIDSGTSDLCCFFDWRLPCRLWRLVRLVGSKRDAFPLMLPRSSRCFPPFLFFTVLNFYPAGARFNFAMPSLAFWIAAVASWVWAAKSICSFWFLILSCCPTVREVWTISSYESNSFWSGCFSILFGLGPLTPLAVPTSLLPSLTTSSVIVLSIFPLPAWSIWLMSLWPAVLSLRMDGFLRIDEFFDLSFDWITLLKWKSSSCWFAESSWYLAEALINCNLSIFIMSSSCRGS